MSPDVVMLEEELELERRRPDYAGFIDFPFSPSFLAFTVVAES